MSDIPTYLNGARLTPEQADLARAGKNPFTCEHPDAIFNSPGGQVHCPDCGLRWDAPDDLEVEA